MASGRYRAQIEVRSLDKRRKRLTATRPTKREALEWLRTTLEAQRAGVLVTERPTLAEWVEVFLREAAGPTVRPSTLNGYRRVLTRYVVPQLGRTKLVDLTPTHVSRLYARHREQGITPWTMREVHSVLRRCLNVALRYGLVNRNVALMVPPPRLPQNDVHPLTAEEARRLIDATRDDRLGARWAIAVTLGLRQGEVLGLWWSDIDLDRRELRVSRQFLRTRARDSDDRFGSLKSRRSRRTLVLPPSLVDALRRHRTIQDQEKSTAAYWQDERLVFTTPAGTPLDHSADTRAFKAALRAAEVRAVRLHDLRHTAATLLLSEGVHPRVVMEMLGHSQFGLTMNTYSHVMPSVLGGAADVLERSLFEDRERQ